MNPQSVVLRWLKAVDPAVGHTISRLAHKAQWTRMLWSLDQEGPQPPSMSDVLWAEVQLRAPHLYDRAQELYKRMNRQKNLGTKHRRAKERIAMLTQRLADDEQRYGTDAPRTKNTRISLEHELQRCADFEAELEGRKERA